MEIYYFSGTGNSLHVAKELQKRVSDIKLIPIVHLLNDEKVKSTADTVGFIFPIHLTTIPFPMKTFLNKIDISSANWIFAIATRTGTFYLADIHIQKILNSKKKKLNSFFILNMVNNSPCGVMPSGFPGFKKIIEKWQKNISEKNVLELENKVQKNLDFIENIIVKKENYIEGKSFFIFLWKHILSVLLGLFTNNDETPNIPFYADNSCNSCKICEKVCLSNKIKITGEKPEWRDKVTCYLCYACFNSCPSQSVLIKGRYEQKSGRYIYPGISPEEISLQK